jgi:transposase-like protein
MPKSYSGDLRERVIEAVETGASRRKAAEHFGVSVSSAIKRVQRWHESRSAAPKPRGGSISPLEEHAEQILALIAEQIRAAISGYAFREIGDYRVWPGPNSNTFVATVMSAVPEISAMLPPTAIGKDFPVDGRWIGMTPSGSGIRVSISWGMRD